MENKEPSGNDKAKQKAAGEEYEQEAEQILRLQGQHILAFDPALSGALNAYLLFVTALVAFGVLAYYSGHLTILKFIFVASGLLLVVLPVSAVWYLWLSFKKKTKNKIGSGKQSLSDRVMESSVGRLLSRLDRFVNKPIWIGSQIALCVLGIALAIRSFSDSPRVSLALIVTETVALVYCIITLSLRGNSQILELWKFNNKTVDALTAIAHALNDHKDSILKSFEHLQDQNEFTKTSVLGVIDLVKLMNQPTGPPNQIDAAPEEKEEPPKA